MLEPRRNKIIFQFFSWYINRIIRSDFEELKFNQTVFNKDQSILLLANHCSWWDGFLMFQINRLYFRKRFHVMITEENYRKVWFLKYLGSFSVKKNSRSAIETLEYAGKLLNDPENLLLIFPQGKLYSGHVDEIQFQKGLINLVNSSSRKFQYIFAASFADYFQHRKPVMTCYLQDWEGAEFTSLQLIKSAFNKHYELSRLKQTAIQV
ncbi:MAG: glycerol acyltransferase [Sphingobacteriales bacterium 17-39-43]|uniref:lysophospholipid acyltransferase family protein n=1 Tax=Daejeonella sp. TaxID=2805397 RepID=UPI000BD860B9|nr:lysophospholipid acyltransferase family protein [Daejeonella sp.]OYZ31469.1 MAG: glycerol acyltransferase [Sphingobacteriales bacterium 16-39-50]OZA24725.1 MAG: glycerol acyltransferase [Sphingobacteriales bacterium 17-39-43]HQT57680.1 lysophospholipid acyltransferase family protein [Daejeonella sp.]